MQPYLFDPYKKLCTYLDPSEQCVEKDKKSNPTQPILVLHNQYSKW